MSWKKSIAAGAALALAGTIGCVDQPQGENDDFDSAPERASESVPSEIASTPLDDTGAAVAAEVEGGHYQGWFKTRAGWQKLKYVALGGKRIYEGDIVLGRVGEPMGLLYSNGEDDTDDLWPNAKIPYTINEGQWGPADRVTMVNRINTAIGIWEAQTRIDFVPMNALDCNASSTDCLYIMGGNTAEPCHSDVGYDGGDAFTILPGTQCGPGAVLHELGHAIGLYHEQNRADRDQYVSVFPENAQEPWQDQYDINSGSEPNGPYDFDSVMHYSAFSATANGMMTIQRKDSWGLRTRFGWSQRRTGVTDEPATLLYGRFDGVPGLDVITATGAKWQYSSNAEGPWVNVVNGRTDLAANVRIGDFNGDGIDDAFRTTGSQWQVSYGATGPWTLLSYKTEGLATLGFGDFDGDGKTDVVRSNGEWLVSYGGIGAWTHLLDSGFGLSSVALHDFDGNGKTDIFRHNGTEWLISYDGVGGWTHLGFSGFGLDAIRFADVDGDGKTDVLRLGDDRYIYSSGGAGPWTEFGANTGKGQVPLDKGHFGDFDGDGYDDLLMAGYFRTQQDHLSDGDIGGATRLYFQTLQISSGGTNPWEVWSQYGDVSNLPDYQVADFDGNGRDDLFTVAGGQWRVKWDGRGEWQYLNAAPDAQSALRFGDFDGDGKTDVFHRTSAGNWQISWAGTTPWQANGSSGAPVASLAVGDFDGDGKDDIFYATGSEWKVSYGISTGWQHLCNSSELVPALRFYDFNGDGKTDVIRHTGTQWQVSWGGTTTWYLLGNSAIALSELRYGDFNGDGKTDMFFHDSTNAWQVSYAGNGTWSAIGSSSLPMSIMTVGDFDGDGVSDILGHFAPSPADDWNPW